MKNAITALLLAAGVTLTASDVSQNYDDHIKNSSVKFDTRLELPSEIKLGPSREIDMSKSPFKREVRRLKTAERRLKEARVAMNNKFKKSGSWSKETKRHSQARAGVKAAKKQLVRRYDILCSPDIPRIEKLNMQVRGLKKKIAISEGSIKEKFQVLHDSYIAEIQAIAQRLVDDAFVYYDFPYADTSDNKIYPSRHRSFYNIINKAVQKAIKKGGFAVAEEDKTEDEDDETQSGSEYTKKYTEITKSFMEEYFDVSVSESFRQDQNPFSGVHGTKINRLSNLGKLQAKNETDMQNRGGQRRETFRHQRAREISKDTDRLVSRKFHRLLRTNFLRFEKHVNQIRRWTRVMQTHEGQPQAKEAEVQLQRHVKRGNAVLQKMVDDVFAHEPYPTTTDTRTVKSRYSKFYQIASKMFYQG